MHTRNFHVILHLIALYSAFQFQGCASDANRPTITWKSPSSSGAVRPSASVFLQVTGNVGSSTSGAVGPSGSVFLQVTGNVYPKGHYYVTMNIGNPPKPYFLDIDTGSDLTWVQCDSPLAKCLPAPHPPYTPNGDLVKCDDPLCVAFHWPNTPTCTSPEQCDYSVEYADLGKSLGVLVKDSIPLRYTNGTITAPRIAFGCGVYQEVPNGVAPPNLDGILGLGQDGPGLGLGQVGILSQLQELGVTKNVMGHCFSSQGDGYMFFGDELVLVNWMPYTEMETHYSLGSAELFVGEKTSGMKDLSILFDSGSTYTYFAKEAYKLIVSLLMNDLKGKELNTANEDKTLPICWKGSKPFTSIQDVRNLFQPIVLSFANSNNARFQMDAEGYLIISEHGNACLGILDGTEAGLGDLNLIGDISFQDKLIIYDNVKKQIGWGPANCNKIPKS